MPQLAMTCKTFVCTFILALASTQVLAQFAQYTPPGGTALEPETRQEGLERAIEEARWRLGPVRLEPWFGMKDLGYIDDGGETTGDAEAQLSATVGAGLRAYLPTGPKLIWSLHALPEYVWVEDTERSRLNGRYGLGLFAFFNRLTAELTARRSQELGLVTPEVLRRSNLRTDELAASLELRALRSLYLFASASDSEVENLFAAEDPAASSGLRLLDRGEQVQRAGLRLRARNGWRIGAGVEWSQVTFDDAEGDRSNEGTSPVLELVRPEGNVLARLDLVWRSLEPRGDAVFVPFEGLTGQARITLAQSRRLEPSVYAHRNLIYALDSSFSYLRSDRVGVSLNTRLGGRSSLLTFIESGRDLYVPTGGATERRDDQLAYGASLQLSLLGRLPVQIGVTRETFDSTDPDGERSITAIRGSITLSSSSSGWY